MLVNLFHGFCMALADSVPGVSGGTIAFILGFYDRFLNALHDLFSSTAAERKAALCYLVKLGLGWVVGMGLAATVLAQV
ncbi:MAG: undecaprenyl phosphate translocase family protein, partial [Agathobaculum sp.]